MTKKAPGKSHRKGMSVTELIAMFPDDASAELWFTEKRWPNDPHCPSCGSTNVLSGAAHKTMPYRCREKECRKRFSVRVGTVMEASNLGFQTWAIAIYLSLTSLKSVSSMKLHRDLKITQKSAWHLAHRLREAFASGRGAFAGPVEADETYMGGRRKNMSKAKRSALSGRGTVGKSVVIGVKDRDTNEVRAKVVPSTNAPTLQGFVREHAREGAVIYTDEATAYAGLERDFGHLAVNHVTGAKARATLHFRDSQSFRILIQSGHGRMFTRY